MRAKDRLTGNLFKGEEGQIDIVGPRGEVRDNEGNLLREAPDPDYARGLELAKKSNPNSSLEAQKEIARIYARRKRAERKKK